MDPYLWLQQVAVGTPVVMSGGLVPAERATVDRVTSTTIYVGARRFRRDTGRMIGSRRFHAIFLEELTPQLQAQMDCRRRRLIVVRHDWQRADQVLVDQVYDLVQRHAATSTEHETSTAPGVGVEPGPNG